MTQKEGKKALGERPGLLGRVGAVSTLLSLYERSPGAGTCRRRCSSRQGLKT